MEKGNNTWNNVEKEQACEILICQTEIDDKKLNYISF